MHVLLVDRQGRGPLLLRLKGGILDGRTATLKVKRLTNEQNEYDSQLNLLSITLPSGGGVIHEALAEMVGAPPLLNVSHVLQIWM